MVASVGAGASLCSVDNRCTVVPLGICEIWMYTFDKGSPYVRKGVFVAIRLNEGEHASCCLLEKIYGCNGRERYL